MIRNLRALAVCLTTLALATAAPFADTAPQLLPFAQDWTNTGLITVNDDWSGVPGIVGYLGDNMGLSSTNTGVDPQTVVTPGTPGPSTIDVIANVGNPNGTTQGGVAEFQLADPVVALQGSGTATAPHLI